VDLADGRYYFGFGNKDSALKQSFGMIIDLDTTWGGKNRRDPSPMINAKGAIS